MKGPMKLVNILKSRKKIARCLSRCFGSFRHSGSKLALGLRRHQTESRVLELWSTLEDPHERSIRDESSSRELKTVIRHSK
ncbi:hypothetical protein KQX54_005334 [Cotesia glomerata]|uniref:Uncharacterized protein n=1 Tax=Cotesia glomerata TaxID=32391 RepID=A0AAV7HP78_COTGL|nr:hypothetical protein KQX54_005334 [Cotesia glomerata]